MILRTTIAKQHPVGSWLISETWRTIGGRRVLWWKVWRVEEGQKPGPVVFENWAMREVDREIVRRVQGLLNTAQATSDEASVEASVEAALQPYYEEANQRMAALQPIVPACY